MHLAPGPLHASAVSLDGAGVLILGASGTGKSSLALALLGLGAALISDDRVILEAPPDGLHLAAPEAAPPLIEVRGVGLLRARTTPRAPLALVVTCDVAETERLPPLRRATCAGHAAPLFHNVTNGGFPLAIRQYLMHGRHDPDA